MLRFRARGVVLRGKLVLPRAPVHNDVERRHKLSPSGGEASPPREKRSREYFASVVDTRVSSDVARCTGFLNRLVMSTEMIGATDMTAGRSANSSHAGAWVGHTRRSPDLWQTQAPPVAAWSIAQGIATTAVRPHLLYKDKIVAFTRPHPPVSIPKPSGAPTALPNARPIASTKGTAVNPGQHVHVSGRRVRVGWWVYRVRASRMH